MLVSFPFFIQSLTGGQKRPESSRYWESGERGECHVAYPSPGLRKRRPPWPTAWPAEPTDAMARAEGPQRCLALCRGCLSQEGQSQEAWLGACCPSSFFGQGLPPWTQANAWGICTIEGLVPAVSFSFHPAGFILWGGIKPEVRGKCVPERQSELAVCSGPGLHGVGELCGTLWILSPCVKSKESGLELFLQRFLRSPRPAWKEHRERSICSY